MSLFRSIIVVSLACSVSLPAYAGKLDDVGKELKSPSSKKTSSSSVFRPSGGISGDNWFDDFIETVVLIASPFIIPYNMVEQGRWRSDPGFLDWPYQSGFSGYGTDQLDPDRSWDRFAGRLQLGSGYAPWGYRFAGDLRLSLDSRLDVNLSGYVLVEPNEVGDYDVMSFYEPGVSWLFALGNSAQFRFGVDLVLLVTEGDDPIPGFTANYSVDWFPVDPFVFTLEVGAGYLNNQFYGHTDVSMGVALGPIEPFVGYEVRTIGQEYIGTASAGLRVWF